MIKWRSVLSGAFELALFLTAVVCFCLLATSCSTGVPLALDEELPTAAVQPTAAASAFTPDDTATPAATATAAPELIDVYAKPDKAAFMGPIDLTGEAVVVVARGGLDWAQLKRPDTSLVWAMRADLPINMNVPDTLPDLLYVAPVIAAERPKQPAWQPAATATSVPAPTATPAPAPTATIVWPTSAPAKPSDFKKPDANASCAFTGCLHPPTAVPGNVNKPVERAGND